jgi:hypothetical protein
MMAEQAKSGFELLINLPNWPSKNESHLGCFLKMGKLFSQVFIL